MKGSEKAAQQKEYRLQKRIGGHCNKWFTEELNAFKKKNLFRKLTCLEASRSSRITISGARYCNFSSNDYLGLSKDPRIAEAAARALKKYGFGSGASRLLSGSYVPHKKLEEDIARFKGTEAALVFNTGYAANTGIIPALVGTGDSIFSDELNHASIIDGARLSGATINIYRHRDMNHLEKLLKMRSRKKLIITDTVFSMDGDIAPLKDIAFLGNKYCGMIMIDDAHGTGVIGKTGKGCLEHFGLRGDNIIQMGTLSKALGCFGGFVAGSESLINLLINRARSFMYSTSLPPAVAQACIRAMDIVRSDSAHLRRKLWTNREKLCRGLKLLGYDTLHSESPIIPLLAGDIKNALYIAGFLYKRKIFAPALRPPTVPEGTCRIRFSVTAAHTEKDIDLVLEKLRKCKI